MSHDPTIFWILKSVNFALNPSFWMIRAYLREASLLSSSDFYARPVSHRDPHTTPLRGEGQLRRPTYSTGDHHLARGEDEGRGFGLPDAHDDGRETLGVVLGVAGMQGNRLQIQPTVKVDRGNDVP